jgi:hypothetical protein
VNVYLAPKADINGDRPKAIRFTSDADIGNRSASKISH